VAGRAVDRNPALLVAIQAVAHLKIHHPDGDGLLRHVSMADLAVYASANMGSMIEADVRRGHVIIDALPGDVFTAREHRRHFLNLRLLFGDDLVASHTDLDVGDTRVRPGIDANVAVQTLKPISQVHFVSVGDRLDGARPAVEVVAQGTEQRAVSRSKDRRRRPLANYAVAARERSRAPRQRRRTHQQKGNQPRPAQVRLSRRMSRAVHSYSSHLVQRMLGSEANTEASPEAPFRHATQPGARPIVRRPTGSSARAHDILY
jgi:hypothetical protein